MPKISLYAEVLTHIRQLTLHASLETDDVETPRIDISSDKKVITVVHGGESSSLFLPTQISGTANVTFLTPRKTELTARVQIEDVAEWKKFDESSTTAPWDATDLDTQTCIQCRKCPSIVLASGTVKQWKNLPNQDWADIMDLWYCHKPHEHHDSDEQKRAAEVKGYSAQSKLASVPGVGMVDVVSFVLHPDDCKSIKIPDRTNENDVQSRNVSCSNCNTIIGALSPSDHLVKLYKSNLAVQKTKETEFVSYSTSTFICAQLLSLVDSSPIRKIVVYSSEEGRGAVSSVQGTKAEPTTKSKGKSATVEEEQDTTSPNRDAKKDSDKSHQPGATPPQPTGHQSRENIDSSSHHPPSATTAATSAAPAVKGVLLWIFNPDIYYSSSRHPDNNNIFTPDDSSPPSPPQANAHRAMKIFYKPLADPKGYLASIPETQIEELQVPCDADVEELYSTLVRSTGVLPPNARLFQDWSVGLLDRYERSSTAEQVMHENPLARKATENDDSGGGGGGGGGGDDHKGDARITRWELPAGYQELYL